MQGGIRGPPPGADYLSRLMQQQAAGMPGAAAAAQQLAGHDALQRQLMYERERGLQAQQQQMAAAAAGQSGLAASQHLQQLQMEEYHRWRPS